MTFEKFQFIYNSNDIVDKKLLAYAKSLNIDFVEIDVTKENITKNHLAQYCTRAEKPLISLLNATKLEKAYSQDANELSFNELSKIVENKPELLNTPIFIVGKKYHNINDISDINYLSTYKAADQSEVFQR